MSTIEDYIKQLPTSSLQALLEKPFGEPDPRKKVFGDTPKEKIDE